MKRVKVSAPASEYAALLKDQVVWATANSTTYATGPDGSWLHSRGSGSLPEPFLTQWQATQAVYVVWSYQTPIAWLDSFGIWFVPDVTYSLTTSNHQGNILAALRELGVVPERGEHVSLLKGRGGRGAFGSRSW